MQLPEQRGVSPLFSLNMRDWAAQLYAKCLSLTVSGDREFLALYAGFVNMAECWTLWIFDESCEFTAAKKAPGHADMRIRPWFSIG